MKISVNCHIYKLIYRLGCALRKINIFLFFYLTTSMVVWAQTGQTIGTTLINVSNNIPQLITLLNGLCVIIGIAFIMMAFFKLKHLADFRNMMSGQQEVGKSIMLIVLGSVFLWMPFILKAMTYTMFGMSIGQLQSTYPTSLYGNNMYLPAFFRLMQVVGLISFIRGWLILSSMYKGQAQHGTVGKAITHLIAGLLLFHLTAAIKIFEKSIGGSFI